MAFPYRPRNATLLLGMTLVAAPPAWSVDYMGVADAQHALLPEADEFVQVVLVPDGELRRRLLELAGPQPPRGQLRIWSARRAGQPVGHLFVDEVQGRTDLITYAAAIDAQGRLRTPEILSYRESHGGEIRGQAWRHQFAGRDDLGALRFGREIRNIAGATLSAEHVTQGVRWLLALWQLALRPGAAGGR